LSDEVETAGAIQYEKHDQLRPRPARLVRLGPVIDEVSLRRLQ
jgi:hypothetical protein